MTIYRYIIYIADKTEICYFRLNLPILSQTKLRFGNFRLNLPIYLMNKIGKKLLFNERSCKEIVCKIYNISKAL